ncbi:MAG: hypothetical protein IJJ42_06315 [Clostridia bacterium]|nr:hypothetical protein [Clostridia bacterium]MBQ9401452.1 hypothetical protein [Clostridia bacterium]
MKTSRKGLRLAAALLALCLLPLGGTAEEAAIGTEEKGLTLGECVLTYPAVTGLPEALGETVNSRLLEDTRIPDYLTRMSQLISGGSLTVGWTGGLLGDVLSCAVSAEGAVTSPRPAHVWTWSTIDLRDGGEIALDDLFADPEGARAELERILEEETAPELSAHLSSSELLPLPEGFLLERTGITLLYPAERLSTLSDRAGAVKIPWHRLRDWLDLSEDGIPARIGVPEMITPGAHTRELLEAMAAAKSLADVPAVIGDSVKELTDRYHLLMDPEVYEGGRLFALEGASFQQVFLLTDFLSESWDASVVQGFRAYAGCFGGLCVGETRQADWEAALGAPDSRVAFDPEKAEYWRVETGTCDYYRFGGCQLQLYADEDGVLRCLALTE